MIEELRLHAAERRHQPEPRRLVLLEVDQEVRCHGSRSRGRRGSMIRLLKVSIRPANVEDSSAGLLHRA